MRIGGVIGRSASTLLLVILLIVLMVSLAITFMSVVSRQRGSAIVIACQTKADVAVDAGYAHVVKEILEDSADSSKKFTRYLDARWRRAFMAVDDPDGNPFTDDGTACSQLEGGSSLDQFVNVPQTYSLEEMTGYNSGDNTSHVLWGLTDRSIVRPYMRWHNTEFLNDQLQLIEILPSLSEAEKADLRREGRYIVRYAASVMDLNAFQSINNNFPGSPVSPLSKDYVKFQNYLRTYGRSIKSQFAAVFDMQSNCYQYRSDDSGLGSHDPLDREPLNILVDGEVARKSSTDSANYGLWKDNRLRIERAFRAEPLKWTEAVGALSVESNKGEYFDFMAQMQKGPSLSQAQLLLNFNYGYYPGVDVHAYVPHADGLLDEELGGKDAVSTPWNVNLLTATSPTLRHMVLGMTSEIDFRTKYSSSTGIPNADLFGRAYPEAFPLSLEDGRDVPLVGNIYSNNSKAYAGNNHLYGNKKPVDPAVFTGGGDYIDTSPANVHSYWMDVMLALNHTFQTARDVWASGNALKVKSEWSEDNGNIVLYKNGMNPSYIDPALDEPSEMINAILMEFYRIMGEGVIQNTSPASSMDYYNVSQKSLLGGGEVYVGAGHRPWRYDEVQRLCKLSPQANTRAMEYLLNDCMISLFGHANPYWTEGDALENIAVDFNGDGYAESTVTGWWDESRSQRVWSWWWDGLGPFVDVGHPFMNEEGWYRFYEDGTVARSDGSEWVMLTSAELADFHEYNAIWLTGNNRYPIKPFSKTGRLYIGKSRVFRIFLRGEVYNVNSRKPMATSHRTYVFRVDPNKDNNLNDSFMVLKKDFVMKLLE